mmetsp:Transcript_8240/g.19725  ORF Transcript_8240/g.19725 Transcript_8240/m.19725 type:complete len:80 (+) Transcript_8240:142-381(+)
MPKDLSFSAYETVVTQNCFLRDLKKSARAIAQKKYANATMNHQAAVVSMHDLRWINLGHPRLAIEMHAISQREEWHCNS